MNPREGCEQQRPHVTPCGSFSHPPRVGRSFTPPPRNSLNSWKGSMKGPPLLSTFQCDSLIDGLLFGKIQRSLFLLPITGKLLLCQPCHAQNSLHPTRIPPNDPHTILTPYHPVTHLQALSKVTSTFKCGTQNYVQYSRGNLKNTAHKKR